MGTILFQFFIVVPVIIFLIYLSLKLTSTKIKSFSDGKYIKVLERVQLSKESSLLLVKIGQDGYVLSSSPHGTEILVKVDTENLNNYEVLRQIQFEKYPAGVNSLINKLTKKKEE